ncbi:hypothetical protein BHE74_00058187 [Ensete ventricosum]|nr:hypothetical protein BHE74_00058187 [Ensete ventricosum]
MTNDYEFLWTVTQLFVSAISCSSFSVFFFSISLRLAKFSLLSLKAALLLLSILTTAFNLHTLTCYFYKVNAHDMLLTVCWEGKMYRVGEDRGRSRKMERGLLGSEDGEGGCRG